MESRSHSESFSEFFFDPPPCLERSWMKRTYYFFNLLTMYILVFTFAGILLYFLAPLCFSILVLIEPTFDSPGSALSYAWGLTWIIYIAYILVVITTIARFAFNFFTSH